MPAAHHQYVRELRDKWGYWATWLPGVPLKLGTIGVVEDGVFVPKADLASFGLQAPTESDPDPIDLDHRSSEGVSISFKLKGQTSDAVPHVGEAEAGVAFDFSRPNAVVFRAKRSREHRIGDILRLGDELVALYERGDWRPEWVVVTHLHVAESGSVLISSSANSKIELSAKGSLGTGELDIADVDAGLSIAFERGLSVRLVAAAGLTPLFRAIRVKKSWFAAPRATSFGLGGPQEDVVEEVDPTEAFLETAGPDS